MDDDRDLFVALMRDGLRRYPDGFRRIGICRRCGCHDHRACMAPTAGCTWATVNLCSACDRYAGRRRFRRARLGLQHVAQLRAAWRRYAGSPLQLGAEFFGRA